MPMHCRLTSRPLALDPRERSDRASVGRVRTWPPLPRAVVLVLAALGLPAAAERAPELPVRAFFGNAEFSGPRISDDGKTLSVIYSQGDLQLIVAREVTGSQLVPLAKLDDPEMRLRWLEWANERRLLVSAQKRDPLGVGMAIRVTRLFGVDRDGKNFQWLGKRWPLFGQQQVPVQYQDRIVHWTPGDPEGVLIALRPPNGDGASVMRMDVDTGALRVIQGPAKKIDEWFADADGNVRVGVATLFDRRQVWARVEPGAPLQKVLETRHEEVGPRFAGFHADPKTVYVAALHEGRWALHEFDLETRTLGKLVFSHPDVDVEELQLDPGRKRGVVGVRYVLDRPEVHFFDDEAAREHQTLRIALEADLGTPVFPESVSASADGARRILRVSSEVQPPVYYLHDREKRSFTRIFRERPALDPGDLAPTRRVTYTARDGLRIPAYLTVPRGVEAKRLPAVALIHGGPWARDSVQWDPEVQLLANRGFAVFQMNFRGSAGYGQKHLEAGYRQWGQKIQDDITDGIRWLIAEGVADPARVGIAGSSFGGYAALVGLVKTPELYRAGAAYASVTDIELMLGDDRWYSWDHSWHETLVGGGRGDDSRLRESSPLRRAGEIRAPVLLGHGENDERVHVRQSRRMADALRKAGKKVEYLEFPHEVHGFLLEASRVKWYERLVAFFGEHLAPPAPEPTLER